MAAMGFADFAVHHVFEVEALRRLFHDFQVAHGIGVDAQRDAQGLAVDIGKLCDELLVDADGQGLGLAEHRVVGLELFQQGACGLCRAGGGSRCSHGQLGFKLQMARA